MLKWKLQDIQQIAKFIKENKIQDLKKQQTHLQKINKVFELLSPKEFDDVVIDSFPIKYNVKTPCGIIDIDHLSSGEKEILFVFTELLDLNLKNSIILFDEPDLHLNEKLQYKVIPFLQGLGENNQIWIVTHSTAIINSVESKSVFRIKEFDGKNQIVPIIDSDNKLDLFYDIVGSKSILTLGEKIVFLEGIESNDKFLLEIWSEKGNNNLVFVSANSVNNLTKLTAANLSLLEKSVKYNYFYCIRDRDFMSGDEVRKNELDGKNKIFVWTKYHIENFLIDKNAIFAVFEKNYSPNMFTDPEDCLYKIKECAIEKKRSFVNKMIAYAVNNRINNNDHVKIIENDDDKKIQEKILEYQNRLKSISIEQIDLDKLQKEKNEYFDTLINTDEWKNILPGRDILQYFLQKYGKNQVKWELFRNLIANELKSSESIQEIRDTLNKISISS